MSAGIYFVYIFCTCSVVNSQATPSQLKSNVFHGCEGVAEAVLQVCRPAGQTLTLLRKWVGLVKQTAT